MLLKILAIFAASIAVGTAFMPVNKAVRAQVPTCAQSATPVTTEVNFALADDELDNFDIPTDPDLTAARNCGFCIG